MQSESTGKEMGDDESQNLIIIAILRGIIDTFNLKEWQILVKLLKTSSVDTKFIVIFVLLNKCKIKCIGLPF